MGATAEATAVPITGNVSCALSGTATLKPGLPFSSPGTATKPFKTSIKFTGTLTGCTGSQTGTKLGAQIDAGTVIAKATTITNTGDPLPSCVGLATPPATPTVLKTTIKFTSAGKTVAKIGMMGTLGTPNLGPPISFAVSGPSLKGAFLGQNVNTNAVLDLDTAGFIAACSAPGGLTTLAFTGAQGPSTLTSP